jgi:hypothetical protein
MCDAIRWSISSAVSRGVLESSVLRQGDAIVLSALALKVMMREEADHEALIVNRSP